MRNRHRTPPDSSIMYSLYTGSGRGIRRDLMIEKWEDHGDEWRWAGSSTELNTGARQEIVKLLKSGGRLIPNTYYKG